VITSTFGSRATLSGHHRGMFAEHTGLVLAPRCAALLSVFEVFFYSHEAVGLQPNLFVVDEVKNVPKNHQDVVPNKSVILKRGPRLAWAEHSRSEAAVKGDHREPRQRACPLMAARAKGTRLQHDKQPFTEQLNRTTDRERLSPTNARAEVFPIVSFRRVTHGRKHSLANRECYALFSLVHLQ